MKLFVIAALIAVSAAARLEHLEQQQNLRAYLPPHQSSGIASNNGFGSSNGFGSNNGFRSGNGFGSSRRPFGAIAGAYGTAGPDQPAFNPHASFPGASDRYLPPDHSASGSVGVPRFSGSTNSLDAQDFSSNYGQRNTFGAQGTSSQLARQNTFGAPSRYQSQSPAINRQYLAPPSSQNIPQQAFDEETGYHY